MPVRVSHRNTLPYVLTRNGERVAAFARRDDLRLFLHADELLLVAEEALSVLRAHRTPDGDGDIYARLAGVLNTINQGGGW